MAVMLTDDRVRVLKRVAQYSEKIAKYAAKHAVPAHVVIGMVAQESAGVPTAVRVEPGFWRRYGAAMIRRAAGTRNKYDDKWMRFWMLASCSYGLMQVIYQTALEAGYELQYPTDLCDPDLGLDAGCKIFRKCLDRADGRTYGGLMRYNGGGDALYTQRVHDWVRAARESRFFTGFFDDDE